MPDHTRLPGDPGTPPLSPEREAERRLLLAEHAPHYMAPHYMSVQPAVQPVVTNPQMPWWAALLMAVLAALPGIVASWQSILNAGKVEEVREVQDKVVIPNVHTAREEATAARQEIGRVRAMMRPPVLDFPPPDPAGPDGRHKEPTKP